MAYFPPPQITIKFKGTPADKRQKVTCAADAVEIFRTVFNADTIEYSEEAIVVFLDRQNQTIGYYKVSCGGLDMTLVDVRTVFGLALTSGALSFILAHNHPTGTAKPSKQDNELTKKLKDGAEILSLGFLDHVILTFDNYYSYGDSGLL